MPDLPPYFLAKAAPLHPDELVLEGDPNGLQILLEARSRKVLLTVGDSKVFWVKGDGTPVRLSYTDIDDVLYVPQATAPRNHDAGILRFRMSDGTEQRLGPILHRDRRPMAQQHVALYHWLATAIVARAQHARGETITAGTSAHALAQTRENDDRRIEFVEERLDGMTVRVRRFTGARLLATLGAVAFGYLWMLSCSGYVSLGGFPAWPLFVPLLALSGCVTPALLVYVARYPTRYELDFGPTTLRIDRRILPWTDVIGCDQPPTSTDNLLQVYRAPMRLRLKGGERLELSFGESTKSGYPTRAHLTWICETINAMARPGREEAVIPAQLRKLRRGSEKPDTV